MTDFVPIIFLGVPADLLTLGIPRKIFFQACSVGKMPVKFLKNLIGSSTAQVSVPETHFFNPFFFGGAMGGLGKILRFIPGPIGKIGTVLNIAQVVGSFALNKMNQQKQGQSGQTVPPKPESPMMNGIKGMFGKQETSLDMGFYLSIPPSDALKGTRKKISYQVSGKTEQLMERIPPNFPSGGKLRIKDKGKIYDDKRGDLILSINVDKNANLQ